jgi:uncharacterized protein (TIGR03032 family)
VAFEEMTAHRALDAQWVRHDAEWRDPSAVASHWTEAHAVDPRLLGYRVRGEFWEVLDRTRGCLLLTREYEHLAIGLSLLRGRPKVTYFRIPHPSGISYDSLRNVVHLASTRNPNQILELAPVVSPKGALLPKAARFYPGRTYIHDLAFIGGVLHANAVGENAVVRVRDDGALERVWWPRCIESAKGPLFEKNHLQLNSIAAGETLADSFFTASSDTISSRRPGHRDFPVDGRGVVFSGKTREPVARGLTRPHSARLDRGRLWIANSGYGEVGIVEDGRFEPVLRLPGWTRGLAFAGGVGFAGTSRVIPRFARYAPGLDLTKSRAAIHAFDARSGKLLGSLTWPMANQIFAIEWAPRNRISGFPFGARQRGASAASKRLFYTFTYNGKAR